LQAYWEYECTPKTRGKPKVLGLHIMPLCLPWKILEASLSVGSGAAALRSHFFGCAVI